MSEWQPIETAPRNTVVIGYCVKLPERWIRVGLGDLGSNGDWDWLQEVPWGPATHWMPLPDPPTVSRPEQLDALRAELMK